MFCDSNLHTHSIFAITLPSYTALQTMITENCLRHGSSPVQGHTQPNILQAQRALSRG